MYLGWYDPDKKKSAADKINDAAARYRRKWLCEPSVAIVNVADAAVEVAGLEVRGSHVIPPNTFFVGEDEDDE